MPITVDGATIGQVYAGTDPIREMYYGSDLVWQNTPRTRVDYQWERARTGSYRIMFMGSSTTAGFSVLHSEQFVPQMAAHITSNQLGVDATPVVRKERGGTASPRTAGFHFVNAGVGGAGSATYWNSQRAEVVSTYQPNLIVHMIGSNDYANAMAPGTFKSNVEKAITEINAQTPPTRHLLVHSYRRLDVTNPTYQWEDYGQALSDIADGRDDTDFCDVELVLGDRWTGEDVLLDDKVHANWFGNTLVARAVSEYLRLESHEGEVVYDWDLLGTDLSDGTLLSSKAPNQGSYVTAALQSSGNNRPVIKNRDGVRSADFYNGAKKMQVDWGGAFAAPMTVVFVARMWNDGFGTNQKPLFTRQSSADDGYMWVWRDTNANRVHAAMGSVSSTGIRVSRSAVDSPSVFAVTFHENGWVTFYPGRTTGMDVSPLNPDTAMGPWMKSLKLMTNTGENNWGEADMYAVRFIKGSDPEVVAGHMRELSEAHGIAITEPGDKETVVIDDSGGLWGARDQLRAALSDRGYDYQTVTELPFDLETSQATSLNGLFDTCKALTTVPGLDTSNVTTMKQMFFNCPSLVSVPDLDTSKVTDAGLMFSWCSSLANGSVRCIGKKRGVDTTRMISNSGMSRLPFYDSAGNWTG